MFFYLMAPILTVLAVFAEAQPPAPTPPRTPRSLSDAAARITLDRSLVGGSDATVLVSNENLGHLAAHGRLTTWTSGSNQNRREPESSPVTSPRASTRSQWRKRYGRQARLIQKIEDEVAALVIQVDRLDLNDNDGRRQARLERAREQLAATRRRLTVEERRLHRIVQDARKDGAQPGWFRDLR